jgi:FlaA1/EpsC-like NDP-sugar epimerase
MTRKLSRVTEILLQQHRIVVLCLHALLVCISFWLSWLLRFDFVLKNERLLLTSIPVLVLIRLAVMARFSLLHGHWRYTGVADAADILKATTLGSAAFFVTIRFVLLLSAFPTSVYIIEAVMTGCFTAAVRLGCRVLAETATRATASTSRKRVIIIGAGFAAQMIIRESSANPNGYWIIGCLDDNAKKLGSKVLGKPVLGTVDQLQEIAANHDIDEVLIAIPSATGAQMRRFVEICQSTGITFSTVPALQDLISGKSRINELRQVDLQDLLGRDPINIDLDSIKSVITGKAVLVTGAAGSIGSELCRQILTYGPSKLLCVDQSETGLFYLQFELGDSNTVFCVADCTDALQMYRMFTAHGVQIVFHAAAYKHVPLMERNIREAMQNNVLGLCTLLDEAQKSNCEAFVMISSDKAVSPTSVMGTTKRIGELLLGSRPASTMKCVSVRFGNVLGSQGSVVPVFQRQISEQHRVTVTHPDITRFFMTIREAVSLVLQASAIGEHGDILVLDMGQPVRIVDLAKTLIRLSGKSEGDVEILFTGLRPGEKLYEELFYEDEQVNDTKCEKIKRTRGKRIKYSTLKLLLDDMAGSMFAISDDQIKAKMKRIVPEYTFGEEPYRGVTSKEVLRISESASRASASAD